MTRIKGIDGKEKIPQKLKLKEIDGKEKSTKLIINKKKGK